MTTQQTICVKCRHRFSIVSNVTRTIHLCRATVLERHFDLVTGEQVTATGYDNAFCRDVNKGDCAKYELVERK